MHLALGEVEGYPIIVKSKDSIRTDDGDRRELLSRYGYV